MRKFNFKILVSLCLFLSSSILIIPKSYCTVSSTTSKVIYVGDGVSTAFPFSYNVYLQTDLLVQKVFVTTGVTTTLTLSTDYTVSLTHAAPTPGTVTLTSPLALGYDLVITRSVPYTQLINISNYSTTPAAIWNEAHDRGVMLSQQLLEKVSRGILSDPTQSTGYVIPTPNNGTCLGWASNAIANLACSGSGGGVGSSFNPPIPDSQIQSITSLNKVAGSALYSLTGIVSGAGLIPVANIDTGTTANKIVQLTAAAKYPAADGSLITKIDGSNLLNLNNTPSGANTLPIANGGTGQSTQQTAIDALLPSQGSNSGKFLTTNGTTSSWATLSNTPGLTLKSTTTVNGANSGTISLTAGKSYKIIARLSTNNNGSTFDMLLNGDSGTNYQAVGTTSAAQSNVFSTTTFASGDYGAYLNIDIIPGLPNNHYALVNGIVLYKSSADNKLTLISPQRQYVDHLGGSDVTTFIIENPSSTMTGTVWTYEYSGT